MNEVHRNLARDWPDVPHRPETCFEAVGCPSLPPLELPRCEGQDRDAVEVSDFLRDPSVWVSGGTVRLSGPLHLQTPFSGQIVNGYATQPWGGDTLACDGGSAGIVALQHTMEGRCFSVPVRPSRDVALSCGGDLSRTCCGHLPMAEILVITGRLEVLVDEDGATTAILSLEGACRR